MKMMLVVLSVLALLTVAPGAVASDDPVCDDQGTKNCAVGLVGALFGGCNPLYDYVQECQPDETS